MQLNPKHKIHVCEIEDEIRAMFWIPLERKQHIYMPTSHIYNIYMYGIVVTVAEVLNTLFLLDTEEWTWDLW